MLMYSRGLGIHQKICISMMCSCCYYIVRKMFVAPLLKMMLALVLLNPKKLAYSFYNPRRYLARVSGVWKVTFDERKVIEH